ncbi:hypothetical protein [Pengzhenrongella sicca]|uniref:Exo-alpha-sialidase n=1 Tax=Pengzhenrongella sicca TaxID=2819238 RepID=A0A8A4ZFB5_9MICO|nr:hypothetical protein [Pengzhenrongella sicca]QTE30101.1 hypothetical protein J4E96_03525 [Pengzhenrongella sicca]
MTPVPAARRVAVVVLAAIAALLLTACQERTPEPAPSAAPVLDVTFTPVDVPTDMRATADAPAVWGTTALPSDGTLPRLAVGLVSPGPSGRTAVRVWSSAADASAMTEQATLDIAGTTAGPTAGPSADATGGTTGGANGTASDVQAVTVAGSAGISAISGYAWTGTTDESFLLTSADRTTWTPVELDAAARAARTHESGADAQRVVLAGDGLVSRRPAVVVHTVATGETSTTALPALGDDEAQVVTGVAVAGDVVVVTAERGPRGEPATPVSYVSTDAGATFGAARDVTASARADVAGVVWTGTEFVATGSDRSAGEGSSRPAAWASPDGATWTPDGLAPFGADPLGWAVKGAPARFSRPTTSNGEVAVAITQSANPAVYLRYRRADGAWTEPVATVEYPSADPAAVAVRTAGGLAAVIEANGALAEVRATAGGLAAGGSAEGASLNEWRQGYGVDSLHALPGAVGVAAAQLVFEFTAGDDGDGGRYGFVQFLAPASYTYAGGRLRAVAWGPPDLVTHSAPVFGTDAGSGTSVLAAVATAEEGFPMHAWVSPAGAGWQPVTGIEELGFQRPRAVAMTSAGWLLAADAGTSGDYSDSRVAALWTSPDGLAWTRAAGQFQTDGGGDSSITAICDLPGGPVAVGWAEDADRVSHATAWTNDGAGWAPVALTDAPGSFFTSCVATETGARLEGSDGAVDTVWETSDGGAFAVVERLADGVSRGIAVEVDGGVAAAGWIESAAFTGPVLWLSADGARWRWVPIPAAGSTDDIDVQAVGADLLVTAQGAGTAQVWTVPDVAAALAAIRAGAR